MLLIKYYYCDQIKDSEMAGHVVHVVERRNAYIGLLGRHEGQRPLGRLRCGWEDGIKMDL